MNQQLATTPWSNNKVLVVHGQSDTGKSCLVQDSYDWLGYPSERFSLHSASISGVLSEYEGQSVALNLEDFTDSRGKGGVGSSLLDAMRQFYQGTVHLTAQHGQRKFDGSMIATCNQDPVLNDPMKQDPMSSSRLSAHLGRRLVVNFKVRKLTPEILVAYERLQKVGFTYSSLLRNWCVCFVY